MMRLTRAEALAHFAVLPSPRRLQPPSHKALQSGTSDQTTKPPTTNTPTSQPKRKKQP